ncbi:MAG: hypothetical protein ACF8R7_12440 [Phycisphaerales bacterium JB039]
MYRALACRMALAGWAAGTLAVAAEAQDRVTLRTLGALPAMKQYSAARGVNGDASIIVGDSAWDGGLSEAMVWTIADGMVGLGVPTGANGTTARAASRDGSTIVGEVHFDPLQGDRAFLWTRTSGVTLLPSAHGPDARTGASDVSADGRIVVGHDTVPGERRIAVRWVDGGTAEPLGAFPGGEVSSAVAVSDDGMIIAGNMSSPRVPFRWTESGGVQALELPPGATSAVANAMSADGSFIVGSGYFPGYQLFRWTQATGIEPLGRLPQADRTFAQAVSDDGRVIVGGYWQYFGTIEEFDSAMIWIEGKGQFDLGCYLGSLGLPLGCEDVFEATALSADGRMIVGTTATPATSPYSQAYVATIHSCYADCDNDGSLNFFDFLCFQNRFASGSVYADCDDNLALDLFDFLCFQNYFNAGCG